MSISAASVGLIRDAVRDGIHSLSYRLMSVVGTTAQPARTSSLVALVGLGVTWLAIDSVT